MHSSAPALTVTPRDRLQHDDATWSILEGGGSWSIVLTEPGKEPIVETSFTLNRAELVAAAVLMSDPEIEKRPGLGRMLAAAVEIHRVHAARTEVADAT